MVKESYRGWVLLLVLVGCADTSSGEGEGGEATGDCASLSQAACEAMDDSQCAWFTAWRADPDTCALEVLEPRCAPSASFGPGCGASDAPGCGGEAAWVVEGADGLEFWRVEDACWIHPVEHVGECQQSDGDEPFEGCACGCPS